MRYDAFISYNHDADGVLAPALQDALQHLAKPWYRRRAMEVFRDETNLSASPELFGAIRQALDDSRYYVLLASPGSAASAWVGREITYWHSTKTAASRRIVLALTDGELVWDGQANRFDPERSTALHPALATSFGSEPLHIDLRDARAASRSDNRRTFRRTFRHSIAKIAARVREVAPDELESEDLRQHRRTLWLAWSAAALLLLLTVASAFGLVSARRNADRADLQTAAARAQLHRATSVALAADAMSQFDLFGQGDTEQRNLALLLAVLANRVSVTPASLDALMSILRPDASDNAIAADPKHPLTFTPLPGAVTTASRIASDGRVAVIARSPGDALAVISLRDGSLVRTLHTESPSPVAAVASSSDGGVVAAQLADGQVVAWDRHAAGPRRIGAHGGAAAGVALSADGTRVAALQHAASGTDAGVLRIFDVGRRGSSNPARQSIDDLPGELTDLQFTRSGAKVVIRSRHSVGYFDATTGRAIGDPVRPPAAGAEIAPGAIVLPGRGDPVVMTYRTADGMNVWFGDQTGQRRDIPLLAMTPGIQRDLGTGVTDQDVRAFLLGATLQFVATPDGRHLAALIHSTASVSWYAFLFDPASTQPVGKLISTTSLSVAGGFTPDGSALVGVGVLPSSGTDDSAVWKVDFDVDRMLRQACAEASTTAFPPSLAQLGILARTTPRPCPRNVLSVSPRRGLRADAKVSIRGRVNLPLGASVIRVGLCTDDAVPRCELAGTSMHVTERGTFSSTLAVPLGFVDWSGTAHDCTRTQCELRVLGSGDGLVYPPPGPLDQPAAVGIGFVPGTPAYVPPASTTLPPNTTVTDPGSPQA